MQHQRDSALQWIKAVLRTRLSVALNFRRKRFDILADQMRKDVCAYSSGADKGLGIPGRGDPHWYLFLYGSGVDPYADLFTKAVGPRHWFARPQLLERLDLLIHDSVARRISLREEDEIVDVPSRSERNRHPSI